MEMTDDVDGDWVDVRLRAALLVTGGSFHLPLSRGTCINNGERTEERW